MSTEEKKFNRDTNIINVSTRKSFSFFVFLAKMYFKDFEEIEIHALGLATQSAVQAAECLIRNNYATMHKIETTTQTLGEEEGRESKKSKLVIVLKKAEGYEEAFEEYEKQREQYQKQETQ